jgi:hypothetical protein
MPFPAIYSGNRRVWMLSLWLAASLLLLIVGLARGATGDAEIGAVIQHDFTGARGLRTSGEERELFFNLPIYSAERVQTGAAASTALSFLDRTRLQVGPNSAVILDKFIYDPDRQVGDVALSFSRGLFRFVTGQMKNKDHFDLRTPPATLVIRGTKFVLYVGSDGRTEVSVFEGEVEVHPCGGAVQTAGPGQSVTVAGNCSGAIKSDGRTAPRDPAIDNDISFFADGSSGDRAGTRKSGRSKP